MLLGNTKADIKQLMRKFQRAPTLGGECYEADQLRAQAQALQDGFQRAPTLGGECYILGGARYLRAQLDRFQRAPTLGGECYTPLDKPPIRSDTLTSFNGHPPLGVNATMQKLRESVSCGEC